MGLLADTVLSNGGKVIGVLPNFLRNKEIKHTKLTELHVVKSMHERKALMNELSDGVISLPGGLGTLDELFEMLTWAQLGLHAKPIGLLNINGYYDSLISFLQKIIIEGFMKDSNRSLWLVENSPTELLNKMRSFESPKVKKWIKPDQV